MPSTKSVSKLSATSPEKSETQTKVIAGDLNILYAPVSDLKQLVDWMPKAPQVKGKIVLQFYVNGSGYLTFIAFYGKKNHRDFRKTKAIELKNSTSTYGTISPKIFFSDQEIGEENSKPGGIPLNQLNVIEDIIKNHAYIFLFPRIVSSTVAEIPGSKIIEYEIGYAETEDEINQFDPASISNKATLTAVKPNPCPPYDGY